MKSLARNTKDQYRIKVIQRYWIDYLFDAQIVAEEINSRDVIIS